MFATSHQIGAGGATPAIRWDTLRASVRSFWRSGARVERTAYVTGAAMLASGVAHIGVLLVSGGSWEGPVSFRKAVTFGLSFGLTLIALTAVTALLPLGTRSRNVLLGLFTIESVLEVTLVSMQAWRGVPSHFNTETPFDSVVTAGLAAGGVAIVGTAVALGMAAFRANPAVSPSLRLALRFGFCTLLVALAIGAAMIARGQILANTVSLTAAFNEAGSLKAAHAAPMHGVLILPALAWLLAFADVTERFRQRIVELAIVGYALLIVVVVIEVGTNIDPFHPTPLTGALSGLGLLVLAAAGTLGIAAVVRYPGGPGVVHH